MQKLGANHRYMREGTGPEPILHRWDGHSFSRPVLLGPELSHSLLGQGGAQGSQEPRDSNPTLHFTWGHRSK